MSNQLGDPPTRTQANKAWSGKVTDVPIEFLREIKLRTPLTCTVGGSSNVTFTLAGSVTKPAILWHHDGIHKILKNIVYTWDSVSNDILNSSGADATDADSVLGVWYMYLNEAGDTIKPSQTAPSYVEAPNQAGYLGHPGTSRAEPWVYIGPMINTTADLAFSAMVKIGFWWYITEVNAVIPTASWAAPTNLTLFIPQLAKHGLVVSGTVETAAGVGILLGGHTAAALWSVEARVAEVTASNVALQAAHMPFQLAPNDTTSPIYGIADGGGAGDIHITGFLDVV